MIFLGTNFRFIAKLSGKYKVPTYPLSSYMHLLLHCGHPPTMWYIVSTDEPPRTHHCHRGSLMVLFILWVWINLKHVSTIIGCRIVSLAFEFSVLYLFISHCSLAPGNHQFFFFNCLHSFVFFMVSYGWNHIIYCLFRMVGSCLFLHSTELSLFYFCI